MNTYRFVYWYRYGEFERDFEEVEIQSKTEDEATILVKELRRWVFSIRLLSINGEKIKRCLDV